MTKGRTFNKIIGLIICVFIIAIKLGSVYAKIGDNPIRKQNLYTYQDNHYGTHIRTDCRPGYTQVYSIDSLYKSSFKSVCYHASGIRSGNFYRICCEDNVGINLYVYTNYHSVGANVVRRYHRGTVLKTSDCHSETVEKYTRTAYSDLLAY